MVGDCEVRDVVGGPDGHVGGDAVAGRCAKCFLALAWAHLLSASSSACVTARISGFGL
jgi:hypothetical protein